MNIEIDGNKGANDGNRDGNDGNRDGNDGNLNKTDRIVLNAIKNNSCLSAAKLSNQLGISKSTVERATAKLKKFGYISRSNGTRGVWSILK